MKRKLSDEARRKMSEGGKKGTTGGFAANRDLARIAGAKGGANGKRGPAKVKG